MGDNYCDAINNRAFCNYDGGDCCASTVKTKKVGPRAATLCRSLLVPSQDHWHVGRPMALVVSALAHTLCCTVLYFLFFEPVVELISCAGP